MKERCLFTWFSVCVLFATNRNFHFSYLKKNTRFIVGLYENWNWKTNQDSRVLRHLLSQLQNLCHDKYSHLCIYSLFLFGPHWSIPSTLSSPNSDWLSSFLLLWGQLSHGLTPCRWATLSQCKLWPSQWPLLPKRLPGPATLKNRWWGYGRCSYRGQ